MTREHTTPYDGHVINPTGWWSRSTDHNRPVWINARRPRRWSHLSLRDNCPDKGLTTKTLFIHHIYSCLALDQVTHFLPPLLVVFSIDLGVGAREGTSPLFRWRRTQVDPRWTTKVQSLYITDLNPTSSYSQVQPDQWRLHWGSSPENSPLASTGGQMFLHTLKVPHCLRVEAMCSLYTTPALLKPAGLLLQKTKLWKVYIQSWQYLRSRCGVLKGGRNISISCIISHLIQRLK
jgi:hypothetical protein